MWKNISKPPPLSTGAAHVWRAFLDKSEKVLNHLLSVLSIEERQQANRFVQAEHRRRFIVAHAALREILSCYLNLAPENIVFIHNAHGKPYLPPSVEITTATPNIQFNMSHSNEVALIAVTRDHEIGIDVQYMKSEIDLEGIAQRFFAPEESRQLIGMPESEKKEAFYRGWTRKEAYTKAIGAGLSFSLSRFVVTLEAEVGMAALRQVDHSAQQVAQWSLGSLHPFQDYAVALAVFGKITDVQYFEWQNFAISG